MQQETDETIITRRAICTMETSDNLSYASELLYRKTSWLRHAWTNILRRWNNRSTTPCSSINSYKNWTAIDNYCTRKLPVQYVY